MTANANANDLLAGRAKPARKTKNAMCQQGLESKGLEGYGVEGASRTWSVAEWGMPRYVLNSTLSPILAIKSWLPLPHAYETTWSASPGREKPRRNIMK
jgi:hypothetical protein